MRYCSLDLELTGFDPLADEILEIGLAFFEVGPDGLKVTEKWSQIFRPQGEVHPKILGLTGLTMAELQQAPLLADMHEAIQQKLNNVVIVGHNIVLDARFLEAFGFQLSGQFIDTLDLVQFLLPTHHSYNLENLMHQFGIPHKEAHRALGDSLAVIALLEQLLFRYQSFDETLRQKIQQLIADQEFVWKDLFKVHYNVPGATVKQSFDETSTVKVAADNQPLLDIKPGVITLVSLDQTSAQPTALALQNQRGKHLLIVPDKQEVLRLWQQGLVHGLFGPVDRFDQAKFEHFLSQHGLSKEQIMFALKVLVWFHTNWQTETIIDLNLTFFGGQFRSVISGRPITEENIEQSIACDYETLALVAEASLYKDRTPVLWGAHQLEQWLSEGSQGRLTWNKVLYLLKSIYNPETDYGQRELKTEVTQALAGADLFFSLVNLDLTKHFVGQHYVSYENLAANDHLFQKISQAAENFCAKVELVIKKGEFHELARFVDSLKGFFQTTPEHIKWIEVSEFNSIFVDRPLHIAPLLAKMLKSYPTPAVVENLPNDKLLDYTLSRLGLFHDPVNLLKDESMSSVQLITQSSVSDVNNVVRSLLQPASLPAVVVFPTKAEVREFYDSNYVALKNFAAVFAQSYSGGSNKILRNFAIQPASILLATPEFVSRSRQPLAVRTAILLGLPEVKANHPYTQALLQYWQDKFPDFLSILSLKENYLLLQTIYSTQLAEIHLFNGEEAITRELKSLPFITQNKA